MTRVRTLFLSDIHLGSRACQAERLLAFLHGDEYVDGRMALVRQDVIEADSGEHIEDLVEAA